MPSETKVTALEWGKTGSGESVQLFTLSSSFMQVSVATYGARITSVKTPDKHGVPGEITLGADELTPYLTEKYFLGATIGRFGNRIAKGQFQLDGKTYQIPLNDGPNALHGGPVGFDQKVWAATPVANGVQMSYDSPDGEMGFPGNLCVSVTFTLIDKTLTITYEADTDISTIVNLTNHAYWNLSGEAGSIAAHTLKLHASTFTPVDSTLIPTGELRSVAGTPLDFHAPRAMGKDWDSADEQIQLGRGYDHNWVIDSNGAQTVLAAEVVEPVSGRSLHVYTTEPGIQFYSGNFLSGAFSGRSNCEKRSGFCLETQHFPDAPNHPHFPPTRVDADSPFRSTTLLVFA
jgi:aldose 1-epimerase